MRTWTAASDSGSPGFSDRLRHCFRSGLALGSTVRIRKNRELYTCGESDHNIYLIENGRVKAVTLARSGKECVTGIYTSQDIVGESCLLDSDRTETVIAMTPVVLTKISRKEFVRLLAKEELIEDCLRYLTCRLVEQQQVITHLVTINSEKRLAATLMRLAAKIGRRSGGELRIDQRITQEELAEMVGTTRSRIGYFLNQFRQQGIIINNSADSFLTIDEARLIRYLDEMDPCS